MRRRGFHPQTSTRTPPPTHTHTPRHTHAHAPATASSTMHGATDTHAGRRAHPSMWTHLDEAAREKSNQRFKSNSPTRAAAAAFLLLLRFPLLLLPLLLLLLVRSHPTWALVGGVSVARDVRVRTGPSWEERETETLPVTHQRAHAYTLSLPPLNSARLGSTQLGVPLVPLFLLLLLLHHQHHRELLPSPSSRPLPQPGQTTPRRAGSSVNAHFSRRDGPPGGGQKTARRFGGRSVLRRRSPPWINPNMLRQPANPSTTLPSGTGCTWFSPTPLICCLSPPKARCGKRLAERA